MFFPAASPFDFSHLDNDELARRILDKRCMLALLAFLERYEKQLCVVATWRGRRPLPCHEPADILQEAFVAFALVVERWQDDVEQADRSPAGWLWVRGANQLRDLLRRHHAEEKRTDRTVLARDRLEPEAGRPRTNRHGRFASTERVGPAEHAAYEDLVVQIEAVVKRWREPALEVWQLVLAGHTIKEVARIVGRSTRSVRRTRREVKVYLAAWLREDVHDR